MSKRVAIIGAGCSGLTAIKCCLEEGLEPICFEKSGDIGGLWRYTEMVEEGRASIYSSVVTNVSKEMMSYSDFPVPENFPVYLHNSKVLEYLRSYAEHFSLLKYIQFKTEVCSVLRNTDFSTTGKWKIVTKKYEVEKEEIFDAVLVCNGHHVNHYLPMDSFPGIEKFKGRYIHSRFYRKSKDYDGKTVLVVGIGNSAGDISVEISNTAKQVFLSTRQGSWVVSRISKNGFPIDMVLSTRSHFCIKNSLPAGLIEILNEKQMNSWFDHANYGLQPTDRSLLKEPILNDYLPSNILCGSIIVKPQIKTFTETSVIFEDGTIVDNLDEVIFATGYNISFPFLDDSIVTVDDNKVFLYKNVFPTSIKKSTLAFVGLVQPLGGIMPVAELQARWATRVFKGLAQLPSLEIMETYIKKSREMKNKSFGIGRSQTLQSYFIECMDEVATEIGVSPNILHLTFTDPQLACQVFFGPCTPYQYRLTGPGKWPDARKAIFAQWNRTLHSTRTRVVYNNKQPWSNITSVLGICVLVIAIWLGFHLISSKTF
ncbi:dimethylaniline monooxygenase [N-oxide-forming] 2-like isoform 1-T3 [Discoglossus pictus]